MHHRTPINDRNDRRLHRSKLSKSNIGAKFISSDSLWDKWLPRLSHLSQFGLFLFTVGTIYFTVIPLYQKALLEEAIAKKEIELKETTAALVKKEEALLRAQVDLDAKVVALEAAKKSLIRAEVKTYTQTRGYELSAFLRRAGFECTGLSRRPVPPQLLGGSIKPRERYEEMLELDTPECLKTIYAASRLNSLLQVQDREHFGRELEATLSLLKQMKSKVVSETQNLVNSARLDPNVLRPATGYSAQAEAFIARARALTGAPSEDQDKKFDSAITRTRNALSDEYESAVRPQIQKLQEIVWLIN